MFGKVRAIPQPLSFSRSLTVVRRVDIAVACKPDHRAARQGGVVARDEVYELGDYDPERSLKGFTRPVNRICQELRDSEVVPADAPDLLVPDYDEKIKGYQRARSFSVPADIIGLLS